MMRRPAARVNRELRLVTHQTQDGPPITTSGFHEDIIVSSRESLLKAALLVAARFGE